jgi:hypothetical protein
MPTASRGFAICLDTVLGKFAQDSARPTDDFHKKPSLTVKAQTHEGPEAARTHSSPRVAV